MQRTHKIRLCPNKEQRIVLAQTAGSARYVYNWGVAKWDELYAAYKEGTGERPTAYLLSRIWTKEKPAWAVDTARYPQTEALLSVGQAWHNHWNRKLGRPIFHKKSASFESFKSQVNKTWLKGRVAHIPGVGNVRLREELRFQGKIQEYRVVRNARQWYLSVSVNLPDPVVSTNPSVVGVDVGVASIAVASDGTACVNPKLLKKSEARLCRMQRKLARQIKGSNRRWKTKLHIALLHKKITDSRNDVIHKFTAALAKNHGKAVIETLDVEEMKGQGKTWLNRLLQDTAMKEVHRQLEYKMAVEKAPPYFRSSKTCSNCGTVKPSFPCSDRIYVCLACGTVKNRDANAADNLKARPWVAGFQRVEPATAMKREMKAEQA